MLYHACRRLRYDYEARTSPSFRGMEVKLEWLSRKQAGRSNYNSFRLIKGREEEGNVGVNIEQLVI